MRIRKTMLPKVPVSAPAPAAGARVRTASAVSHSWPRPELSRHFRLENNDDAPEKWWVGPNFPWSPDQGDDEV
jgi:hypothetical protein